MALASELKKGSYFIYHGEPVCVVRKEIVVCGTHCHSKLKLFIQGLNKKGERSINMQHIDKVEVLDIIKKTGQIISKSADKVQIMDTVSYETLDAIAPKELIDELNEGDEVIFVNLNENNQILEKK
ncbi:MAG: hypothetical protein V1831_04185 [Candidatus Woesearchaeota archaeon]